MHLISIINIPLCLVNTGFYEFLRCFCVWGIYGEFTGNCQNLWGKKNSINTMPYRQNELYKQVNGGIGGGIKRNQVLTSNCEDGGSLGSSWEIYNYG